MAAESLDMVVLCPFSIRITEFNPYHTSADLTSGNHLHQHSARRCDPNGHHESAEPNFSERLDPAPLITQAPPLATVSAGSAIVVVQQELDSDNFVIEGTHTVVPGKPITTEVIVGTTVIFLQPNYPQATYGPPLVPPPPILTAGTTTVMPVTALVINRKTSSVVPVTGSIYTAVVPAALTFREQSYTVHRAGHIIMGQEATLTPGGNPVTIDGTTLSLEPSGSAVAV
ncbi:hypothetical protein COCMIDRAFT_38814 [Bipolaris oryzae ATCC 44560]|uniref:Uncharacterized protein n=1 Tax=Bipolaris oryzae ATCC 44560 TaxID=930090 RepID=W6Z0K6_COCMI|nr:uncharacterized protein COCMIDRAFT_38814 [Bipolaris oryzae ATCC 44560]EUC43208.1 hypothetical protein COCMIDRAFT_38814 [Bipolaris oryzae ATCC 44560]